VFAWKASKFITHWKRLSANSVNSLELLEDRLSLLGFDKAGPILVSTATEFSCRWRPARIVLQNCSRRIVVTVSNSGIPSWYAPRILRLLSEQNVSLCLSDHHDAPAPWRRTADFVYVRGHGPGGRLQRALSSPTCWPTGPGTSGHGKSKAATSFVYFDNDQKSAAPADALKLRQLLVS